MKLIGFVYHHSYAGLFFTESLEETIKSRQKRGKLNKKIRWYHYCLWARALLRKQIGPEDAQYTFPQSVLDYIRHLAPGDIVGQIRKEAFPVTMDVFCEALGVPNI